MTSFLGKVAIEICKQFKNNLNEVAVVFPNRRAKVFFIDQLQKILEAPFLLPKIYSIDDFIERISNLKIKKNEDLLFPLFLASRNLTNYKDLNFEEFIGISGTLISDFNQLDLELSNNKIFFESLSDTKAIEIWNPDGSPPSDYQIKYLNFWKSLPKLHEEFCSLLLKDSIAYQGLAYRTASEKINNFVSSLDYKKIYICGFNSLFPAENKIINLLLQEKKAEIFWDFDKYYSSENQESGKFIRINQREFSKYSNFNWIENNWETITKKIKIIGVAQNILQAKLAGNFINEWGKSIDNKNLKHSAIVLCDEMLLIPVLNSISEKIEKVNVTMGYPLNYTLTNQLIDLYIKIYKFDSTQKKEIQLFYYSDLFRLFTHPYFSNYLSSEYNFQFTLDKHNFAPPEKFFTNDKALNYFGSTNLNIEVLKTEILPSKIINGNDFCNFIIAILKQLLESKETKNSISSIEIEAILSYLKIFEETKSALLNFEIFDSNKIFRHFFRTISKNKKLDFVGEPLDGLQIMGLLETRTLDFKNLILLSCNEGMLPPSNFYNSFIPFDVKRNFGWQNQDDKEAIYAYHFYRLLQRAENVYLLYNTETDELGSGEPSRFITQLKIELKRNLKNVDISEELFFPPLLDESFIDLNDGIIKTKEIMETLNKKLFERGLSATSLNYYRNCPLRFYYLFVSAIQEEEVPEDNLNASDLGNLIHHVFEKIFSPFLQMKLREILLPNEKNLVHIIEESFKELFSDPYSAKSMDQGSNLLMIRYAYVQIKSFLEEEKIRFKDSPDSLLVGIELKKETIINFNQTKIKFLGKADRIEKNNEYLNIFDYKTGSVKDSDLNLKDLNFSQRNSSIDKAFQLLFYSWLFYGEFNTSVSNSSIIYLRNHKSSFYNLKVNKETNFDTELNNQTNNWIKTLVDEMLDPNIHFYKTSELKNCQFCQFKQICKR